MNEQQQPPKECPQCGDPHWLTFGCACKPDRYRLAKACPRCGQSLSNNSYEAYCSNDDCRWNNP